MKDYPHHPIGSSKFGAPGQEKAVRHKWCKRHIACMDCPGQDHAHMRYSLFSPCFSTGGCSATQCYTKLWHKWPKTVHNVKLNAIPKSHTCSVMKPWFIKSNEEVSAGTWWCEVTFADSCTENKPHVLTEFNKGMTVKLHFWSNAFSWPPQQKIL